MTPDGTGLIEWLAVGGSAEGVQTDATGYAAGATTILLSNTGTGYIRAGERVYFAGDDNGHVPKYSVRDVSGSGLATSATTDAAGYAIGVEQITLAAAGTGAIIAGNVFYISGDATAYTATSTINDVSAGGTISFTPALVQAVPASATALTVKNALTLYIGLQNAISAAATDVRTGQELKRSWGASGYIALSGVLSSLVTDDVFSDWFAQAQVAQLWLDLGYTVLDEQGDKVIEKSVATSGVSQTAKFRQGHKYRIRFSFAEDLRSDTDVADVAAIESIIEALEGGVQLVWFPDYTNYPTEFYFCTLDDRKDMNRRGTLHYFDFEFTLRIEPQISVNIPTLG